MENIIVDHAVSNVWIEPDQDYQHLIRALAYNGDSGRVGSLTLPTEVVRFPVISGKPAARFHLYHFGNLPKQRIAINNLSGEWKNAMDIMADDKVQIDIVLSSGVTIPRSHVWFKILRDQNIVMAIWAQTAIDLGRLPSGARRWVSSETVYVRFYRNAITKQPLWQTQSPNPTVPNFYRQENIVGLASYNSFMSSVTAQISAYGKTNGHAMWYLDGFRIKTPTIYDPAYANHLLSVFFDSTVKAVVTRSIEQLQSFKSLVDLNHMKYWVAGDSVIDTIDYHDDVDIFVGDGKKSVYLAKVNDSIVRQVTHSSYAVSCSAVLSLLTTHGMAGASKREITLYIREGGMNHQLINNSLYFEELYKLDQAQIRSLLVDTGSVVPCWQAREIESSDYNLLISSRPENLTPSLVARGYGYHMVQKVLYTPLFEPELNAGNYTMVFSAGYAQSPVSSGSNASVYYYDANGHLISAENRLITASQMTNAVVCTEQTARLIEVLPKRYSDAQWGDVYFAQNVSGADLATHGFRCYICTLSAGGVPDEQWLDVTDSAWYVFNPMDANFSGEPSITWNQSLVNQHNAYTAVKIDRAALFYEQDVSSSLANGFIRFSVTSRCNWLGASVVRPHSIAYENLNVWMDGQPLVMGIDYHCKWPQIVIVKPPADHTQTTIHVRAYGLSTSGGVQPRKPDEIGFTCAGLVSTNHRYNLWKDRLCRVVLDNQIKPQDSIPFSEFSGVTPWSDGRPYEVRLYRFNVDYTTEGLSDELRNTADIHDTLVSDQLSALLADNHPYSGVVDGQRHKLYSPVLAGVIYAMVNYGFLNNGELSSGYSPADVASFLGPYLPLLDFDPARQGSDGHFVNILPHYHSQVLTVTSEQYSFLQYLIKHYLRDQVDLNPYVQIGV